MVNGLSTDGAKGRFLKPVYKVHAVCLLFPFSKIVCVHLPREYPKSSLSIYSQIYSPASSAFPIRTCTSFLIVLLPRQQSSPALTASHCGLAISVTQASAPYPAKALLIVIIVVQSHHSQPTTPLLSFPHHPANPDQTTISSRIQQPQNWLYSISTSKLSKFSISHHSSTSVSLMLPKIASKKSGISKPLTYELLGQIINVVIELNPYLRYLII